MFSRSRSTLIMVSVLLMSVAGTAFAQNAQNVKTSTENVPVYTANGTKIAVIKKPADLKVLRQSGYMLLVEYSDDNLTLVGWVAKANCIIEETSTEATATEGTTKPAPAGGSQDVTGKEDETKRLSMADSRRELRQILKVPVNYIQQTEVDKRGTMGKSDTHTETSKLYMRLNPTDKNADGYAEISVLTQFDRDSIVTFFVNQKITQLEEFKLTAAEEYGQVVECYVEALEKYNDDLRGNFLSLCTRANKYERLLKDM